MVSKASDDLPEPDRPVITISRSRGRSRSMFFRLWVRAPRMRMVSIAIGGGDLGSGGGGRRRERDRTEERNEPPIWGQMAEIASLPERRRSGRDAARSGARCPGTRASGNLQERRKPRALWGSRGTPGLASRAAARARGRAGRAPLSAPQGGRRARLEEHQSELQALMRHL